MVPGEGAVRAGVGGEARLVEAVEGPARSERLAEQEREWAVVVGLERRLSAHRDPLRLEGGEVARDLHGVGAHDAPVGSDELGADDVVAGQAVLCRQVSDAASEREAADAGRSDDAARRDEPLGDRRRVEVEPRRAAFSTSDAALSVDVHAPLLDIPEDAIHDGNDFDATFVDTVSVRAGGEWVFFQKEVESRWKVWKLKARAGGGYDPSPLAAQGVTSSLLDSNRLFGTLGFGVETWDPFQLIDAPVKLDFFGQVHTLRRGSLIRESETPVAGYPREGNQIPYGGLIGVFGAQIGFDYH